MRRSEHFFSRSYLGGEGHQRRHVKLSVIMAAHNEERTIKAAVSQVLAVDGPFELELIVVDDGSTDATLSLIGSIDDPRLIVLSHPRARGKGAAVLSAAMVATGTHLLLFDADLEYSASDIPTLVEPVLEGVAEVVYGARVAGFRTAFSSSRFKLGSDLTTLFANLVFDSWLADMHTCLKLIPLQLFRQLVLSEQGFGLDTEITGELLRRGVRPYEVPCAYRGRTRAEGKKISTRDGLECLKIVMRVRLRGVLEPQQGESIDFERLVPSALPERAIAEAALSPAVGADDLRLAPSRREAAPNDADQQRGGRIIAFSGGDDSRMGL